MVIFCRLLLAVLLAVLPQQLHAAAGKVRSQSGSGILLISNGNGWKASPVVLYREPGLGRIAEVAVAGFPQVNPPFTAADGWRAVIVTAKRLNWYRVIYDEGEREGWLEGRPFYRYQRWDELLKGRKVALPAGLRIDYYMLRSEPDLAAAPLGKIEKGAGLDVMKVAGDWIEGLPDSGVNGWLRWRDDNGRLLISVNR